MIPPLIVEQAISQGITLLAITDHNASANVEAVMQAARGTSLSVLPGMEMQTHEEVHLLCLFDTLDQLAAWQKTVDDRLPVIPNRTHLFGEQFVVDATGEFIRREERLLLNSVKIELGDAVKRVSSLGGLAIPAHVDRKANGLMELLGLLPPGFEALEISRHITPLAVREKYPFIGDIPLLQNGDVHYLDGFLGVTEFELESLTIADIRKALNGQDGRAVRICY